MMTAIGNFLNIKTSCVPKRCVLLFLLFLLWGCTEKQADHLVGGACSYDTHAGRARIVSIKPVEQSDEMEVKFIFLPAALIQSELFKPDKPYTMYTRDLKRPSKAFIQANNLKPDKEIDAEMQLIKQGTCTPVIFNFPKSKDTP